MQDIFGHLEPTKGGVKVGEIYTISAGTGKGKSLFNPMMRIIRDPDTTEEEKKALLLGIGIV